MRMAMTWFTHVGPEMKILADLKAELEMRKNTVHDSGYHDNYIFAIDSIIEKLELNNNEVPNEYHPEVQKNKEVKK